MVISNNNMLFVFCAIVSFLTLSSLPKHVFAQGLVENQNPIDSIALKPEFRSDIDSVNFTLLNLARQIIEGGTNHERISRNATFAHFLEQSLFADSLFHNDFDSVLNVSVLYDKSRSFRIATWYVPMFDGTIVFHGFLQTVFSEKDVSKIYEFVDKTRQVESNLQISLGPENWYGAFYYDLIEVENQNQKQFVLLGWKGDNPLTRKRVIEPLVITEEGLFFGNQVFQIGEHKPFRIVFEYSRQVSMSLDYKPNFAKSSRQAVPMIVFDRLAPSHSDMEGIYEYYVPEVNVFDGLEFVNGIWMFIPDIDVRVVIDPSLRPLGRP